MDKQSETLTKQILDFKIEFTQSLNNQIKYVELKSNRQCSELSDQLNSLNQTVNDKLTVIESNTDKQIQNVDDK